MQGCVNVPVHAVNVRIGRLCQWHVRANVNSSSHFNDTVRLNCLHKLFSTKQLIFAVYNCEKPLTPSLNFLVFLNSSKIAATAGANSIDIIWHEKSAEDTYLTNAIDGRIRIQLLLP